MLLYGAINRNFYRQYLLIDSPRDHGTYLLNVHSVCHTAQMPGSPIRK